MRHDATEETAILFDCGGDRLVGIVHQPRGGSRRGVLIVVGGPQYRIGSHRQFLLLARSLAAGGLAVMRFDHRGIGDSEGAYLGFEHLHEDIAAALDAFQAHCPDVHEFVLWGLCDAASAILFYAHSDPRIAGIVLVNPWVRTPESEARTYLRHYYRQRLTDLAAWRRLLTGRLDLRSSIASLVPVIARRLRGSRHGTQTKVGSCAAGALPDRMAEGLGRFQGPVLLIMSGRDLTAREFDDTAKNSPRWRDLLTASRIQRHDLAAADHTLSRQVWRDKLIGWTSDWIRSL